MSDPPRIILLDSNAYFRLAISIHPLLNVEFGKPPPYRLYVLVDLDVEYARSPRLRNKFEWVRQRAYREDRAARQYRASGKIAKQVDMAISFLAQFAHTRGVVVSPVDLKALAVGHVRGYPVVSDDGGMAKLADEVGIECWPLLKLLKLMVDEKRIVQDDVLQILEYLKHEQDLPTSNRDRIRRDYREHFGEECPF